MGLKLKKKFCHIRSWDGSFSIVFRLWAGSPECDSWQGQGFFSLLSCLDQMWGTPSLLSCEYWGLFPWGYSGWGMKLINHFHLVPRLRICEALSPLPFTSSWCGA